MKARMQIPALFVFLSRLVFFMVFPNRPVSIIIIVIIVFIIERMKMV